MKISTIMTLMAILFTLPCFAQINAGGIISETIISQYFNGFDGELEPGKNFGKVICSIGDIDGDGITDLAVNSYSDNYATGSIWILFMNGDKTVKDYYKITPQETVLSGKLENGDCFGSAFVSIGDLNKDGVPDIATGAWGDDGDGKDPRSNGAVWILFLKKTGSVLDAKKIYFDAEPNRLFGYSLAYMGDINKDGNIELAVGAPNYDAIGTGTYIGAVWIMSIDSNGAFISRTKLTEGTISGLDLDAGEKFGFAISNIGDIDKNGYDDLAVSTHEKIYSGGVYILLMDKDYEVKSFTYHTYKSITGLDATVRFAQEISYSPDLDKDGIPELLVGAYLNHTVLTLYLNSEGSIKDYKSIAPKDEYILQKVKDGKTSDTTISTIGSYYGSEINYLGDIDKDGYPDYAVGSTKLNEEKGGFHIISLYDGKNNVSGSVMAGGELAGNGTIQILDKDESVVYEFPYTNGIFEKEDIAEGEYYFKAIPEDATTGFTARQTNDLIQFNGNITGFTIQLTPSTTSLSNKMDGKNLKTFPNPAAGHIWVTGLEDKVAYISLINSLGQITTCAFESYQNSIKVKTAKLAEGIYSLQIYFANGTKASSYFNKR